jgi:hypothetical protein
MYQRIAFAALVAALSGCGAGDNAATAGTTSTAGHLSASAPAFAALTLNPATASATVPGKVSRVVALEASFNRAADFAGVSQVYVQLADHSVFEEAYVTPDAAGKALVALYTSDKLTPGKTYKGSVSLRLCKDEACTQTYQGSPVEIPYIIEVQAAGT